MDSESSGSFISSSSALLGDDRRVSVKLAIRTTKRDMGAGSDKTSPNSPDQSSLSNVPSAKETRPRNLAYQMNGIRGDAYLLYASRLSVAKRLAKEDPYLLGNTASYITAIEKEDALKNMKKGGKSKKKLKFDEMSIDSTNRNNYDEVSKGSYSMEEDSESGSRRGKGYHLSLQKRQKCNSSACLKSRYKWARGIQTCGPTLWKEIVFFDKMRFYVKGPDDLDFSLSLGTAICYKAKLHLIRTSTPLKTNFIYLRFLKEEIIPFGKENYEPPICFQYDNSSIHYAKLTYDLLKEEKFLSLDWPSNSHDISPFYKVWKLLIKNINKKDYSIPNEDELFNILQENWEEITLEMIQEIIDDIPQTLESLIKHRGEYIL